MFTHCLVLDLHVSGICIALARWEGESHVLADFAGRVVHPLDSPLLWGSQDDRLNRVELVRDILGHGDSPRGTPSAMRNALVHLIRGVKTFTESRLEHDVSDMFVVLAHHLSPQAVDLVKECAAQVGFNVHRRLRRPVAALMAYALEQRSGETHAMVVDVSATRVDATIWNIDEEICELLHGNDVTRRIDLAVDLQDAIEDVLRRSGVARDRIDHVVFTGAIAFEMAASVGVDVVLDLLPAARLENTIEPNQVCAVGGMSMACRYMKPSKLSHMLCCLVTNVFTIGIETGDGVCEPLLPRNTILPTTKRTRVRVFRREQEGTVELRFCEGERDVFTENVDLGTLRIDGLRAGWTELELRLDMREPDGITIDVTTEGLAACGRVSATSASVGMGTPEITTYFDELERLATRADERERRQRLQTRHCTETVVAAACRELGRRIPALVAPRPGEVVVIRSDLIEVAAPSGIAHPLVGLLDQLDHSSDLAESDATEQALHIAARALLEGELRWVGGPLQHDRCRHCAVARTIVE